MADRVSKKTRSKIMASVGTRDTGPERLIRAKLHRLGFRYIANDKRLPGKPDIVFPRLRKIIFVHGCFWHGHSCRWGRPSKSRTEYWCAKIVANQARDARVLKVLRSAGWRILVVWQCQLRNPEQAIKRAVRFLSKDV